MTITRIARRMASVSHGLTIWWLLGFTAALSACTGGTPWGATPQNLPQINLPSVEVVSARVDASTNAGAQRLAERVRNALLGQSALAGAQLGVEGFEGGLIVLSGRLADAGQRALVLSTTRQVPGVGDVADRMTAP